MEKLRVHLPACYAEPFLCPVAKASVAGAMAWFGSPPTSGSHLYLSPEDAVLGKLTGNCLISTLVSPCPCWLAPGSALVLLSCCACTALHNNCIVSVQLQHFSALH